MLTDGAPTRTAKVVANAKDITKVDTDADSYCSTAGISDDDPDTAAIESAIPRTTIKGYAEEPNSSADTGSKASTWLCSLQLASINKTPSTRNVAGNPINSIVAPIKTSTVILGPEGDESEVEMKRVARVGGGSYTKANNTQALVDALSDVKENENKKKKIIIKRK